MLIHKKENNHFSTSEAMIIKYILEKGAAIKAMTVHVIAAATFTSAPLLIRIAKKLGYP